MPTKLYLTMSGDEGEGKAQTFIVQEPFEVVADRMVPEVPPNSAAQSRQFMTYDLYDGGQLFAPPNAVAYFRTWDPEHDE